MSWPCCRQLFQLCSPRHSWRELSLAQQQLRWARPCLGPCVMELLKWVKLIILNYKKWWKILWNWTLDQVPILHLGSWLLRLYSSLGTRGCVKAHYWLQGLLTTALPAVLQERSLSLNVLTNVQFHPWLVFLNGGCFFPNSFWRRSAEKNKICFFFFHG